LCSLPPTGNINIREPCLPQNLISYMGSPTPDQSKHQKCTKSLPQLKGSYIPSSPLLLTIIPSTPLNPLSKASNAREGV